METHHQSLKELFKTIRLDLICSITRFDMPVNMRNYFNFFILPGSLAVIFYRLSRYLYLKGFEIPAQLLQLLNNAITSCDIDCRSSIGKGFVLYHSTGSVISAKIGENVCIAAQGIIGTDGSDEDIGAGKGRPIIGDNVIIGSRVIVCGSVSVGKGSNLTTNTVVTHDIPPMSLVSGHKGRVLKTIPENYNMFHELNKNN